ncbi:restriction endonuclease subunit S [Pseudoalteromonas sp. NC201]|uniref:restriction endonuclease subunit S n=1 Tax=Pseudoalteromonas sp. NC201 TaxID=1514074 RepID=UPI000C7CBA79|nr:restriction endonuclease subunit S [Pseudoalteromonas sp. NC201]AUJ68767.1 EcoKI restriction-modification system protein HsdS [Pseudoalteromonas sp. NC201]
MSALEQVIPEGYKQTEVGVIPSEWEVNKVSKAFEICNTLRFPLSAKVRESMAGEYPYYGPTRIQDYINECRIDGEYALIGEDGDHFLKFETVPQTQLAKGKFNVNNHAHVIKGKVATAEWFYLFFKHREITSHLSRQGAGRYKLNKATLEQLPCAIPPKQEQTAIANALSDVDALLTELEKLIAKKQAIKTASMQQLLTGKTRLPQFATYTEGKKQGQPKGTKPSELGEIPEDWETRTLKEMATSNGLVRGPFGGALKKEHFSKSGYKVYEQRNAIYANATMGNYFINQKKFEELKRFAVNSGDFIVSCSGTIGKIFKVPDDCPEGVINQALLKITLNETIDPDYFGHYFKWDTFQEKIIDGTQGGAMKNLVGMSEFKESLMPVPICKREQIAIATILSDMDNEIQTLEQRLAKTRQIKQGMMQELLTGRTRLPY